MTDFEITKLCAEAMGYPPALTYTDGLVDERWFHLPFGAAMYDPLHDDAQAMALEDWLIERGELSYGRNTMIFNPFDGGSFQFPVMNKPMRRSAICECVARIQNAATSKSD